MMVMVKSCLNPIPKHYHHLTYLFLFTITIILLIFSSSALAGSLYKDFNDCYVSDWTIIGTMMCRKTPAPTLDGTNYTTFSARTDYASHSQDTNNNHWEISMYAATPGTVQYPTFIFKANSSTTVPVAYCNSGGTNIGAAISLCNQPYEVRGRGFSYSSVPLTPTNWYRFVIDEYPESIRVRIYNTTTGAIINDQTGGKTNGGSYDRIILTAPADAGYNSDINSFDNVLGYSDSTLIQGYIINATTGYGVPNATVCNGYYEYNCDYGGVYTDSTGYYTMTPTHTQDIIVSLTKSGYFSRSFGYTFVPGYNNFLMYPNTNNIFWWATNYSLGSQSKYTVYVANPDTSKYYFESIWGTVNNSFIYLGDNGVWYNTGNPRYYLVSANPQLSSLTLPSVGVYTLEVTACDTLYGTGCTLVSDAYTNVIYTMPNPNGTIPSPTTTPFPVYTPQPTPNPIATPQPTASGDYSSNYTGTNYSNATQNASGWSQGIGEITGYMNGTSQGINNITIATNNLTGYVNSYNYSKHQGYWVSIMPYVFSIIPDDVMQELLLIVVLAGVLFFMKR